MLSRLFDNHVQFFFLRANPALKSVVIAGEVSEFLVTKTILYVKCQRQAFKRVSPLLFVIVHHVPEEGLLIAEMVIGFHLGI